MIMMTTTIIIITTMMIMMTMIIVIITIIIIIIIIFKDVIPHCVANHLQHVRSSGPGAVVCKSLATHRALITCNVSCYVPRLRRDSSAIKFDRV